MQGLQGPNIVTSGGVPGSAPETAPQAEKAPSIDALQGPTVSDAPAMAPGNSFCTSPETSNCLPD